MQLPPALHGRKSAPLLNKAAARTENVRWKSFRVGQDDQYSQYEDKSHAGTWACWLLVVLLVGAVVAWIITLFVVHCDEYSSQKNPTNGNHDGAFYSYRDRFGSCKLCSDSTMQKTKSSRFWFKERMSRSICNFCSLWRRDVIF